MRSTILETVGVLALATVAVTATSCATEVKCEYGIRCASSCDGKECPRPCGSGTDRWQSDGCEPPSAVHLNTVGFLPGHNKLASVLTSKTATFSVKRADGTDAYSGTLTGPVTEDSNTVMVADFSAFTEPGEYYLDVSGVGRSVKFRIDTGVYTEIATAVIMGLHGQRCGMAVSVKDRDGRMFTHEACHTDDAAVGQGNEAQVIDVTGGWHDAGDYGKYSNNAAFALSGVLGAWERNKDKLQALQLPIPEHGGALPDVLAEAKYQLDQLLKMQREDGSVYYQVSHPDFEGFVSPSMDGGRRTIFGWGTVHTADVGAVAAQGARVFKDLDPAYAAKCQSFAEKAWAFLKDHPSYIAPDMTGASHDGYGRSWGNCATSGTCDLADRLWIAAELWDTNGDASALAKFEELAAAGTVDANFDWANPANIGRFTYLLSKREGRDPAVVTKLTDATVASADSIAAFAASHAFGRGLKDYWWGSNGVTARLALNLMTANALVPKPAYVEAVVAQLDYLLGRNSYGRSFVTGLGAFPPMHPHHRPSQLQPPWPGLLVGGANGTATSWKDSMDAYDQNEVAINWSAAMFWAAAALVQ